MQTFEVSRRRRRETQVSKPNDSSERQRSIYKHLVAPRMQKPRKGRSKRDWNGRPEKATEVTQESRQKN